MSQLSTAAASFRDAVCRYSAESGQGITLLEQEPLARHTTFHIGGEADLYLEPSTEAELQFLLCAAREYAIPTFVMGRGSNLLFDDAGFRGAVIATSAMRSIVVEGTILTASAGATLRACANAALESGLTGLEFAHGIPGSVGGAVFMNAGAYDGEIAGVLRCSRYYERETDTFGELRAEEHAFGYRESAYRTMTSRVILSAEFVLQIGDTASIRAKMEDFQARRSDKQPLEYPSAGSTFKRYPGRYTAQMIDEAGLKGYRIGDAQVSEKHAGFIVNRGHATAADVRALITYVHDVLAQRFGVDIETEVISVGEYGHG